MHRLHSPVREYAWGSRTHIPRLSGSPVTEVPIAEKWFGAHPTAPSRLDSGRGLDELIEESPSRCLGAAVVDSFGPRLPFLLKLLAAAEPLSLQVHPTSERARIRFAHEDAAGLPTTASDRSYPDPSHKPELLYALTRFEGMAGFRDPSKTARILRMLEREWADSIADGLDFPEAPFQALRGVVTDLLRLSGAELRSRLNDLKEAARSAEARSHRPKSRLRPPDVEAESVERESVRVFAQTSDLIERYPQDPGVLVTLLLNHVVLAAGEAMFIDAGVMHAYTSGFGVEIMAASDNVVRAGLTPKHVDVQEMLEITNFTPIPPPRWKGLPLAQMDGVLLSPPVEEFELVVATLRAGDQWVEAAGPVILLCLEGSVSVQSASDTQALASGEAVFVEAGDEPSTMKGSGRAAIARVPTVLRRGR
ncbi:MAG: mannose-6-phosphate isomerase [Nocardioidaceae bacterium]|nr:mannose-6-phosphate isomerase [Nocardioidaceae bacterium]